VFLKTQKEPEITELDGTSIKAYYSSIWVEENLDYQTLLNNFIYLFDYVDYMFRSTFVNKKSYTGILLSMIKVKGKREYDTSFGFNQVSVFTTLQMAAYENELFRNGVDLLQVFKWFFETYIYEEFKIANFKFNIPSPVTSHFEKCKFIISEIESVLKQFQLYVEEGEIDHELLQISSHPILFKDVPSLLTDKYLYSKGEDYEYVAHCLFSNQCMLAYIPEKEIHYDNFFELISAEEVCPSDYKRKMPELDGLIEKGYIRLTDCNMLEIASDEVYILRDLYFDDVTCSHYLLKYKKIIDVMVAQGRAEFGSTLFSTPEQDYLNYVLNRAEFSNGLDLRNKYAHGTQPDADDEQAHVQNYYMFMKILALIIIKINEELCLRKDSKP
ncbi:MAG: hypothetical protein RR502_06715, partial [Oscillospiraceae bacterium]